MSVRDRPRAWRLLLASYATGLVLQVHKSADAAASLQVLASAPADEHDTQFRALLAAATVAHGHAASSEMARDLGFVEQAQQAAASARAPEKLRMVAQDVQHILKQ